MSDGFAFDSRSARRISQTVRWAERFRGLSGRDAFVGEGGSGMVRVPGIVWDEGPEGEQDYDDDRYWVILAEASNTSADKTAALEFVPRETNPKGIVTVTNVAESLAGSHSLQKGMIVFVWTVGSHFHPDRIVRWATFASVGGDTDIPVVLRTNDADANNEGTVIPMSRLVYDGGQWVISAEIELGLTWHGTKVRDYWGAGQPIGTVIGDATTVMHAKMDHGALRLQGQDYKWEVAQGSPLWQVQTCPPLVEG